MRIAASLRLGAQAVSPGIREKPLNRHPQRQQSAQSRSRIVTRASRNLPDLASVRRLWYGNEVMPSEPNGEGSGSVPGVIRPPQLSHLEISAKGGRAKSEAKRRASLANLEKAKLVREAIGARPWHGKKSTD